MFLEDPQEARKGIIIEFYSEYHHILSEADATTDKDKALGEILASIRAHINIEVADEIVGERSAINEIYVRLMVWRQKRMLEILMGGQTIEALFADNAPLEPVANVLGPPSILSPRVSSPMLMTPAKGTYGATFASIAKHAALAPDSIGGDFIGYGSAGRAAGARYASTGGTGLTQASSALPSRRAGLTPGSGLVNPLLYLAQQGEDASSSTAETASSAAHFGNVGSASPFRDAEASGADGSFLGVYARFD